MKLSQTNLQNITGIDRTYLSRIENGRKSPSVTILFRICHGLQIEPWELLKVMAENDDIITEELSNEVH